MAASLVQLEDGHVCCCAADVEEEAHGCDGDVDCLVWCTAQSPVFGQVRGRLGHLRGSCQLGFLNVKTDVGGIP